MFDTVVVGGGVAGLTAGLFAARCGLSTLVIVSDIPGGHLANVDRIEDFPGFLEGIAGYELGPTIQEQADRAGAQFQMASAARLQAIDSGWRLATSEGELEAKTVIIAAGSRPRRLGVPGEERLTGRGVSHCATCDGPLLRGQTATVIGGGDSAFQEALTLAGFGGKVVIANQSGQPNAQECYQRRVREDSGIELRANSELDEVLGETTVTGVRLRNIGTGAEEELEAAGVFVYVGLEPNSDFLKDVLRLDSAGRIPTDVWMRTALPGVFAAGDIRSDSASQAVTAAGDGATAALAARAYLKELSSFSTFEDVTRQK